MSQYRKQQFQKQIRKSTLQQHRRQLRRNFYYSPIPLPQLCNLFSLPPESTFVDILTHRKEVLLHPFTTLTISDHILFWMTYSTVLFDTLITPPQLPSFILHFMQTNTQQHIHHNVVYQLQILNTLQTIADTLSQQHKYMVLSWIHGTEGLRVIQKCIPKGSLNPRAYPNVYKVIELGFKSQFKAQSIQAAEACLQILIEADWDGILSINEECIGLVMHLINKVRMYSQIEDVKKMGECITWLLVTYDETVMECARVGIGLVAAELITSPIQLNAERGMEVMKTLSEVEMVDMVRYLLYNIDIVETMVWKLFCGGSLRSHRNEKIKQYYYEIIERILAHGQQEEIIAFTNMYTEHESSLIDVFEEALKKEENSIILCGVINGLKTLIYYGNYCKNTQENIIIKHIVQSSIIHSIREWERKGTERVKQLATEILESIDSLE